MEICKPIKEGGLEFRRLRTLKSAFLGKQISSLVFHPLNLWCRHVGCRYNLDTDLWNVQFPKTCSKVCRTLMHGIPLVNDNLKWEVDSRRLYKGLLGPIVSSHYSYLRFLLCLNEDLKASDLFDGKRCWGHNKLLESFDVETAQGIMQIPFLELLDLINCRGSYLEVQNNIKQVSQILSRKKCAENVENLHIRCKWLWPASATPRVPLEYIQYYCVYP